MGDATQWGDFNQIENGYWKQTSTVASRDVQEHVYIPIDETQNNYLATPGYNNGFTFVGYISGASPSATIARLEICLNYEALLDNTYTDYLPSGTLDNSDIEPKNVPGVLTAIKREVENLSPKQIEKALEKVEVISTPDSIIQLPPSKKEYNEHTKSMNSAVETLKTLVKDSVEAIPAKHKNSLIGKIMDVLSPVASGLISNVVS